MGEQRMFPKKRQNENYLRLRTGFCFCFCFCFLLFCCLFVSLTDASATPGHRWAFGDCLINIPGHRGTEALRGWVRDMGDTVAEGQLHQVI